MSVNRKEPSPVARVEGQDSHRPASISRIIRLRHTIAQPVLAAFLAGGVAGAVSRTVVSPLERLKILFQIQSAGRTEYKLPVGKGLMKMWKDEGWRGFMRGNGANCVRIIPYSAVQFSSYNSYRKVRRPSVLQLLSPVGSKMLIIVRNSLQAFSRVSPQRLGKISCVEGWQG